MCDSVINHKLDGLTIDKVDRFSRKLTDKLVCPLLG